MFKKTLLLGAGGLLVLGLLFGRNLVPYAGTAVSKAQSWADSRVETSYKIDTARGMLKDVDESIENMVYEIAKQKVDVNRLGEEVESSEDELVKAELHIKRLRDHLESGQTSYVSTGRSFDNSQVRENLAKHFKRFQIKEERLEALQVTLTARESGLHAAYDHLDTTKDKRMELASRIENLEAQLKMLEVAKTASKYTQYDGNSDLAKAEKMLDEAQARIDTDAEVLRIAPQLMDSDIPMEDDEMEGDVLDAVNARFGSNDSTVVKN